MDFIVFITLLFAISSFHRREHRLMEEELRQMQQHLPATPVAGDRLEKRDWRITRTAGQKVYLKRAFEIDDAEGFYRYAVPVAILSATMIILGSWLMAGIYAAALAVKWFLIETVMPLDPPARYEAELFGLRLFGTVL